MKYAAIIFDLFGTLVDFGPVGEYERTITEMARVLSAPLEDFQQSWTDTYRFRFTGEHKNPEENIRYICSELGLDVTDGQIRRAAQVRLDFSSRSLTPRDDVPDTINELKARGYKIGLISDCTIDVPTLWNATPFPSLIDEPVFSCSVGLTKPDPQIYHFACDRLGVKPADCLYVGDGGSSELTGASEVGMYPVLIRAPHDQIGDSFRISPSEWSGPKISSIREILTLVE